MTTQEATTQDTPQSVEDMLANLPDARVEDTSGFVTAVAALVTAANAAVREWTRATNAAKALAAARVVARSLIIRTNGYPDWQADSDSYRILIGDAENPILSKLGTDAKGRLSAAVRQHVKRSMLLPGIVHYVLTHGTDAKLSAEAERWIVRDEAGNVVMDLVTPTSDQLAIMSDPSAALIAAVRKHYKAADLSLPAGPFAYDQATTGGSGGPEASDPPSALGALDEALGGLGQIVPRYATVGLLRAASDVSAKLTDPKLGEVEDRQTVIAHCDRIARIMTLTAKVLEGKGTEKDADALAALFFDPKADAVN